MTRPYFNMAICVFSGCERDVDTKYNLKFTCNSTKERYFSQVPMCFPCFHRMRDSKDENNQAQMTVAYSPTHTSFLDEGFSLEGREANVQELSFIEEGGETS